MKSSKFNHSCLVTDFESLLFLRRSYFSRNSVTHFTAVSVISCLTQKQNYPVLYDIGGFVAENQSNNCVCLYCCCTCRCWPSTCRQALRSSWQTRQDPRPAPHQPRKYTTLMTVLRIRGKNYSDTETMIFSQLIINSLK